jgi:hypothetical protein
MIIHIYSLGSFKFILSDFLGFYIKTMVRDDDHLELLIDTQETFYKGQS